MSALAAVTARIEREGPLRFDVFMDLALYGEGGFFSSSAGRGAGRRADFLTSVEVGSLFGAVVAAALDAEWSRLGRPDPFVVVEGGAGRGALARAVLDAAPACSGALRYVCVERSAALRLEADGLLPTEPAANVFGAVVGGDLDEERVVPGTGPVVAVLDDLPLVPVTGVVLANELLDNLPFRLLERVGGGGWAEVFVAVEGGGLGELLVTADDACAEEASRLAPSAEVGARVPLQHEAVAWLRRACETLVRGRVLLVDYADSTASLAARPFEEWLRTYRGHARGGHPLAAPGEQDITCEVAVDQLARFRAPSSDVAQSVWLTRHGLAALRSEAAAAWTERAHIGDLEALRWRSRVGEADALSDPAGLGAFRVLEWEI